jgi:RimJ/RimL family protein N-acetyltransferase
VDRDLVTERLRYGYYDGPGRATFIVTDGAQRIGLIWVGALDNPTPAFDLRIASAHRGHGHGIAALRVLARWMFHTYDVERLEGTTRQDNDAMRRTFRAVGFAKEAHYRRGWPTRDGRLFDAVGYALLRTDWRDGTTTHVDIGCVYACLFYGTPQRGLDVRSGAEDAANVRWRVGVARRLVRVDSRAMSSMGEVMDTITTLGAGPAAGEVAERPLAGYWCARTRGTYRFISPVGWPGATSGPRRPDGRRGRPGAWVASMKTFGYG